jgi:WD40 repeat protein
MKPSDISVEKTARFTGHREGIYALAPGGENNTFFSAGADGMIAEWNVHQPDTGKLLAQIPAPVYALRYLPEKHQLVAGHNFSGLHLIDLYSRQEVKSVEITKEAVFCVQSYGNQLFAGTGDGSLLVLNGEDLSLKKTLRFSDKSLRCLAINPLTQEIAAGYSDCYIRIFDLPTLMLKYVFEAHLNSVFCLHYSPDSRFLLSGSRDARLKVWACTGYELQESVVAHLFAINSLSFHPEGRFFATASMDKAIKVWETGTWQLLKVIDKARHAGHGTSVNVLFWSKMDNLLLSGSDDRTVSAWKIQL